MWVGRAPEADPQPPDLMEQQHDDALSVFLLVWLRLLAYAYLLYREFFLVLQLVVVAF
jgi:hypothetical protein